LGETAEERNARINRAVLDGTAADVVAGDGPEAYLAETMAEAPTISGKGGGSGRAAQSKKRGTKICKHEGCGLEARVCGHEQRGRPSDDHPKTRMLRVDVTPALASFVRRSKAANRLRLAEMLDVVLSQFPKTVPRWDDGEWGKIHDLLLHGDPLAGSERLRERCTPELMARINTVKPTRRFDFGTNGLTSEVIRGCLAFYVYCVCRHRDLSPDDAIDALLGSAPHLASSREEAAAIRDQLR